MHYTENTSLIERSEPFPTTTASSDLSSWTTLNGDINYNDRSANNVGLTKITTVFPMLSHSSVDTASGKDIRQKIPIMY